MLNYPMVYIKLNNTEKNRGEKLTLISPEIKKQGFYASSYKTHMKFFE